MSQAANLDILGIAGSLRKGSYNRMLIEAAKELAPDGMTIRTYEGLADIPIYNGDDEDKSGIPAAAETFRAAIAEADALLISTPEYNWSLPGGLKNALDWASRGSHPFKDKPLAVMGASGGPLGTARSQYHLRATMTPLECIILPRPEIFVGLAASKFDDAGKFTDEVGRDLLGQMLAAFKNWIARVRLD